jgi:hypothetical protein
MRKAYQKPLLVKRELMPLIAAVPTGPLVKEVK